MATISRIDYTPWLQNNGFVQGILQNFDEWENPDQLPWGTNHELACQLQNAVRVLLNADVTDSQESSLAQKSTEELVWMMDPIYIYSLLLAQRQQHDAVEWLLPQSLTSTDEYSARVVSHLVRSAIQKAIQESPRPKPQKWRHTR